MHVSEARVCEIGKEINREKKSGPRANITQNKCTCMAYKCMWCYNFKKFLKMVLKFFLLKKYILERHK